MKKIKRNSSGKDVVIKRKTNKERERGREKMSGDTFHTEKHMVSESYEEEGKRMR